MAKDVANDLGTILLSLDVQYKSYLAQIRHWLHLKMAIEGTTLWIKDFEEAEMGSPLLKSIPFTHLYRAKDNLLFPEGSLLPSRKLPSLLWTPIEKALPLTLPDLNHNFFGINQKVRVRLLPATEEQPAIASYTSLKRLRYYMEKAPAIRLQSLQWCLFPEDRVLIIGNPLLPVEGHAFWQRNNFLLPGGYDLEFPLLAESINHKINPDNKAFIFWTTATQYILIPKHQLKPLTRSSFRLTINPGS